VGLWRGQRVGRAVDSAPWLGVWSYMPTAPRRPAPRQRPVARGRTRKGVPALGATDFASYVQVAAARIAPADVTELLAHAQVIEARLSGELRSHKVLAQRGRVALHLLNDHAHGKLPQIPYHTVSHLAAALFYFLDPMDVVPDFIPGAGLADDALVFELAWQAAAPGVERFLAAKGLRAGKPSGAEKPPRQTAKSKSAPRPRRKA
jgi:uncharacterized membrane protein YkvA (DUF1232 family)